ncbi:hypothetical protein BH23CHL5_BH23CHL5_18570 [soil metagenome]
MEPLSREILRSAQDDGGGAQVDGERVWDDGGKSRWQGETGYASSPDRCCGHPLTAPPVSPCMSCFWKNRKMMMTGMVPIAAAAMT